MSSEQHKALVRRFFETMEALGGKASLDSLDEMLAPDFASHNKLLSGQQPGREGYKQVLAELLTGFSNHRGSSSRSR